jgi:hypothetical protein
MLVFSRTTRSTRTRRTSQLRNLELFIRLSHLGRFDQSRIRNPKEASHDGHGGHGGCFNRQSLICCRPLELFNSRGASERQTPLARENHLKAATTSKRIDTNCLSHSVPTVSSVRAFPPSIIHQAQSHLGRMDHSGILRNAEKHRTVATEGTEDFFNRY